MSVSKSVSKSFLGRNPDFFLVWTGQVCSQSGLRMAQMALIWWILSKGLGGSAVGTFMVLTALPSILLSQQIGNRVDRTPSRYILMSMDGMACLLLLVVGALLAWTSFPLWGAFVVGLVGAVFQAHIDPTLNKAVQAVVPTEDTEAAVSFLASTQSVANFAGAVMGAGLIDLIGIAATVALAGVGYGVATVATYLARFRFEAQFEPVAGNGWAAVNRYPLLKRILIGFSLINFFATPILVVLPLYVKKTLEAPASVLGALEACIWLGILSGALLAQRIHVSWSRVHLAAACLSLMGVGWSLPAFGVPILVYGLGLFVAGAALGVNNVKFISLFQQVVDPEIKGRFFAMMQAMLGFTFPIAYFLFGMLTDLMPPEQVCLIQGIGVVTLALYFISLSSWERSMNWREAAA